MLRAGITASGPVITRIGITIEDDLVTFVRVLHRKEIYRFFP
jgi:hypothetical protein